MFQVFVETLDKCFENVCELDLIFHVEKVWSNFFSYFEFLLLWLFAFLNFVLINESYNVLCYQRDIFCESMKFSQNKNDWTISGKHEYLCDTKQWVIQRKTIPKRSFFLNKHIEHCKRLINWTNNDNFAFLTAAREV